VRLKIIIVSICLILGIGIFVGIKVISKSPSNLKVVAGELQIKGYSFTIKPSKYTYQVSKVETFKTTVRNLSDEDAEFDMGDGTKMIIPARAASSHSYTMVLNGDIMRIPITRIPSNPSGLRVEERLILKLEPVKSGGTI